MEKLFDLLKQHCRKRYGFKDNDDLEIDTDSVCFHLYLKGERLFPIRVETVICKEFGFIKWLDENNKIDFSLIPNKIKEIGIPMKINGEIKYGFDSSDYYWLLMLLSIQDEPIQFLISLLK